MQNDLTSADIIWQGSLPFSAQYQDIYFSRKDGLAESRYVFLKHNELPDRFSQHAHFTLFEIGFGTGLNFLATWQAWESLPEPKASLHYLAVEKFPLKPEDIRTALSLWPELAHLLAKLLAHYPPMESGRYTLHLAPTFRLTLLFGDALDWLPKLTDKVDAWYLDGFAPKHNADLWQDSLYHHMARLSHASSTFSTFTSVGSVRRGLNAVGFSTCRPKGFGYKRQMLRGIFKNKAHSHSV
jgi:tRNA 5-methylaminomethyl-2-thiouridine biosynthesis bifunctional protein